MGRMKTDGTDGDGWDESGNTDGTDKDGLDGSEEE